MSSCRTTSDNFYSCCPAKMADQRMFTDYRSSCRVNTVIREESKSENSYDYRQFLIKNADTLIESSRKTLEDKNKCDAKPGPIPDFKTVCRYDKRCGGCHINDKCGLGLKNE